LVIAGSESPLRLVETPETGHPTNQHALSRKLKNATKTQPRETGVAEYVDEEIVPV
jgi:hypothetical protein